MTTALFFERLQAHFERKLPFVVYRKPNENTIYSILQNSDELFYANDFTEKGFVFSPFDDIDKTILMPLEACDIISLDNFHFTNEESGGISLLKDIEEKEQQHHITIVKKGVKEIKKGILRKVVLSRKEVHELINPNPFTIFKKLLSTYVKGFVYCWYHPKVGLWLGATPETLIKIENQKFSVMALAGTQQYKGEENVVWQNKEIEEQQYVTDFITENIKTSVINISVSNSETVKSGNLLHLKSTITGTLNLKDINLKQFLEKLHPTPAVCGVPKPDAKVFILKNENYNREFYTGFLGELNFEMYRQPRSGKRNIEPRTCSVQKYTTQLYVNLRCMQLKGGNAIIYVGGGITKLSNAESEWEETVSKSMIIKTVL
ncbi:chorismate-binding protein [Aestuariivivens sp. NBU2969]|uniref:chorismate-binding protein n=1 Tax=Aestuariivivens sp. NBU2969 TaxID=2873267 RepID=UPI001CBED884|nr:chorismate-binding protein [Aestuariivivens sp. NBU2969]